jgi:serine/threonine protein kinase
VTTTLTSPPDRSGVTSARAAPTLREATDPEAARTRSSTASGAAPPAERAGRREPGLRALTRGTPYRAARRIGEGGMGEVYEVVHECLLRRCVLKVLHRRHRHRTDLALRMRDEARAVASLHHPGIVDVFDLGLLADGRPYFAMELLVGNDLRRILRAREAIEVPRALDLAAQALDALAVVHEAGIVHRDVKLENLFLCADGALKVIDFGVARIPGARGASRPGGVLGTPRTMAPEQCPLPGSPAAGAEVDGRADLYALGLALYELVAGRGPFDELRGDREGLKLAHALLDPPPPSLFAPQPIPWPVEVALLRALAKRPEDRFPSAAAMADALRSLRGERRRGRGVAPFPVEPTRARAAEA